MITMLKNTLCVTSLLSAIIISKTDGAELFSSIAGKGTGFLLKK